MAQLKILINIPRLALALSKKKTIDARKMEDYVHWKSNLPSLGSVMAVVLTEKYPTNLLIRSAV